VRRLGGRLADHLCSAPDPTLQRRATVVLNCFRSCNQARPISQKTRSTAMSRLVRLQPSRDDCGSRPCANRRPGVEPRNQRLTGRAPARPCALPRLRQVKNALAAGIIDVPNPHGACADPCRHAADADYPTSSTRQPARRARSGTGRRSRGTVGAARPIGNRCSPRIMNLVLR
jgi:hypothetical protein